MFRQHLFTPLLTLLALGARTVAALPDATADVPLPSSRFEFEVDDPMLAPPARPGREVENWEEALGLVRAFSTDVRSAEAEVQRAGAVLRQALSAMLPNARLSGNLVINALDPTTPTFGFVGGGAGGAGGVGGVGGGGTPPEEGERRPTAPLGFGSISISQSLIDVGAWRGRSAAARAEESTLASLKEVRRRLTLGLARALVSVVAAERIAELNRLGLRHALERAALTERTFEHGAATRLDLLRVSQDVELARGALVAGDEQLRRAREALGLALGQDHDIGVRPSFNLRGLVDEAGRRCTVLPEFGERPDLVAARARVEAAAESRRQASAGYLPTLGLASNLVGFTTTPGPGRLALWSVSAVFSVPLWEGGLREGRVRESEALQAQAAETLERTRREASIEVAQARRGVEVAEALLQTAKAARDLAEHTDELTRRSFQAGRATSLELVQSAAALREADVTLAAREFQWVQARLDAFLTEATCNW